MTSRTFRTSLNVAVAVAFAAAALLPALTAERPAAEGGWVAHDAIEATQAHAGKAKNLPTWKASYAARFAGCSADKPAGAPQAVVAVVLDDSVHRVATAEAWSRIESSDFWIVGFCS